MTRVVRTRFAPSPTGELHTGSVRTALINRLFATHHHGTLVLRIDDTDIGRSTEVSERAIYDGLGWLGIEFDEGPFTGGDFGPYRQSERTEIYAREAERLLGSKDAYYCRCTKERLAELASEQRKKNLPPRYDGRCREQGIEPGGDEPTVVRFAIRDDAAVEVDDMVHGRVRFDRRAMGDFIIIASDGSPAYNFASTVDDGLMRITHVIRGDDHLPNTPRQVLLMRALGYAVPEWCHLPLVLAPDHTPLGKRHGGTASIRGLREAGYLPEAVTNALARLGYTPGAEGAALMSIEEMARAFDPARLSKSPSVFDVKALSAINREAIAKAPASRLAALLGEDMRSAGAETLERVLTVVKADATDMRDLARLAAPFIGDISLDTEARSTLAEPGAIEVLKAFLEEAERNVTWDAGSFDAAVRAAGAATDAKGRTLFMPIRLAMTGAPHGISLTDAAMLLGKGAAVERVGRALRQATGK